MEKPTKRSQFGIRALLLLILAVAIALGIYAFWKPNYGRHLNDARNLVGKPDFTNTSCECNKKLTCADGSEFYLYFFSTNDGKVHRGGSYMMTVITIPDAEQYYKIEPFSYNRARAISDERVEGDDTVLSAWVAVKPSTEPDLAMLAQPKDLDVLRKALTDFEYKKHQ